MVVGQTANSAQQRFIATRNHGWPLQRRSADGSHTGLIVLGVLWAYSTRLLGRFGCDESRITALT